MTPHRRLPRSNAKQLSEIRVRKQNRNANAGGLRDIVGIDTETQDGNIFLIADSERNWLDIANNNITFAKVAEFLLQPWLPLNADCPRQSLDA